MLLYMKLQVKSRKTKGKTRGKGKKTGKKSRKTTRRMKLRGGMNDLGAIFMKLVENKKKLDAEEKKQEHAQSPYRQDLDEEKENVTAELREKVNNEAITNKILALVHEYIIRKNWMNEEVTRNQNSGSDAVGPSESTMEYYELLLGLEELGINIDPAPSAPKKRPRVDGDEDGNEDPYKHVLSIGEENGKK